MWKRIAVNPAKSYVLELCQDGQRVRYFVAREFDAPPNAHMVVPVSACLIAEYRLEELGSVRLSNGETFTFGPHGEWFTEAEAKAIQEQRQWSSIPWHEGIEPRLPPK